MTQYLQIKLTSLLPVSPHQDDQWCEAPFMGERKFRCGANSPDTCHVKQPWKNPMGHKNGLLTNADKSATPYWFAVRNLNEKDNVLIGEAMWWFSMLVWDIENCWTMHSRRWMFGISRLRWRIKWLGLLCSGLPMSSCRNHQREAWIRMEAQISGVIVTLNAGKRESDPDEPK